jgi:prepilin-type N-terminal cleavage/methylation domain-containing protein
MKFLAPISAFSSAPFGPRRSARANRGFTLVELLVVVAIMAIMLSILIMSISGVKGSRDLGKATYDIQGVLEQARTTAMATGTYTWVGFFEEDPSTPGTAGTGQVVISVISSAAGTNLDPVGSPVATLPAVDSVTGRPMLVQVNKLIKVPNVHLAAIASTLVTRPAITAATPANYQVGSGSFPNTTSFYYPVSATTAAAAQYTFNQIIQFNPQGDATRIADYPTPLMEVGLLPTHGHTLPATTTNAAVIQVAGIGGQVFAYRP